MKIFYTFFSLMMAFVGLSLSSCVESDDLTFDEVETIALQSWMEKNRPDLLDNYQPQGGYYVELLNEGVADSVPLRHSDSWVWYDITCRDLAGNVIMTRSSDLARLQSSYTEYTHYAPYFLYCGDENNSMIEGTYMALRNILKIGDKEYAVRYGTKMRLYLPSSIVGNIYSDGGYEGQYSLDKNKPLIAEMEIMGHVTNPLAYEDQWIKSFAEANGGLAPDNDSSQEESSYSAKRYQIKQMMTRGDDTDSDKKEPIMDDKWRLAVDTIAALYINYRYTPKQSLNFDCLGADTMLHANQTSYKQGKIYGVKSLADLNKEIDELLLERFGEGLDPAEAEPADSVSSLDVWYITRLMDGFIIDTNIPEVKRLIYNDPSIADEDCEALSFDMENEDNNSYVDAWKYAIPQMRVGSWNVILTGSSNAYGATGVAGSHSTSSSSSGNYYDYYNYYNYYNSYYGNSYYNDYYGGYYGGYGYGYGGYGGYGDYYNNYYYNSMYYNNYYNNSYTTDTTTSTTTTSEVPAYSPLLFQVFVEETPED